MSGLPLVAAVTRKGELAKDASVEAVSWWSFTKTLMAAAALKLSEQRRLQLDQPVEDHPFTARQLLQHRAGVGDYGALQEYHAAIARQDAPWSENEVFARVSPARLLFPPGEGWAYSNVGYLIVRRLLERTTGDDLAAVLRDLILSPLGIVHARVARTADEMAGTTVPPPHGYDPNWVFHGVVRGPVSEAALLLHRLLEGSFLSLSARAILLDRQPLGGPIQGRPWATIGYGTGAMMPTVASNAVSVPLAGHSASGPGSVGAVYHAFEGGGQTVAAFSAGKDEGVVESIVVQRLFAD